MMKKVEVRELFIIEFNNLKREFSSAYSAMNEVYKNGKYKTLGSFLFENDPKTDNENQATFVNAWIGEIELVKKQDKYVIYQVDDDEIIWLIARNNVGVLRNEVDTSTNILKNHRSYKESSAHFDEEFASAMRDTGYFEIEKVED